MSSSSPSGDRKPARLINLTLALLATKRYLTKSQILTSVEGYEGYYENPATVDRMFERDKDELRQLGIEIEVGSIDPFFEDEMGYRITPSSYALRISDLNSKELALLSLAASLWRDSALAPDSQSALRKFRSLGIPANFDDVGVLEAAIEQPSEFFQTISSAIESRQALTFHYFGSKSAERTVHPYSLILWHGFWYLVGEDQGAKALRIFKLLRIDGEIKTIGKKAGYEIPADFAVAEELFSFGENTNRVVEIEIERDKALLLRERATPLSTGKSHDRFELAYESEFRMIEEILWNTPHVKVISPFEIQEKVIAKLQEFMK